MVPDFPQFTMQSPGNGLFYTKLYTFKKKKKKDLW